MDETGHYQGVFEMEARIKPTVRATYDEHGAVTSTEPLTGLPVPEEPAPEMLRL